MKLPTVLLFASSQAIRTGSSYDGELEPEVAQCTSTTGSYSIRTYFKKDENGDNFSRAIHIGSAIRINPVRMRICYVSEVE
mgnify:CR=1 FL=1